MKIVINEKEYNVEDLPQEIQQPLKRVAALREDQERLQASINEAEILISAYSKAISEFMEEFNKEESAEEAQDS